MSKFITEKPTRFLKSDSQVAAAGSLRVGPPIEYSRQVLSLILPVNYKIPAAPEAPEPADFVESEGEFSESAFIDGDGSGEEEVLLPLPAEVALKFGLKAILDKGSSIQVSYSEDRQNWFGSYVPSTANGFPEYPDDLYEQEENQDGIRTIQNGADFMRFKTKVLLSDLPNALQTDNLNLFVRFIFDTPVNSLADQFLEIDENGIVLTIWDGPGHEPVSATTPIKKMVL